MRWPYLISGFLTLLVGAYIDNVRGPLLPKFKLWFSLSYAETSTFLVVAYLSAIFSSLLLLPLLNRYGDRKVMLGVCLLGILTCFTSFCVTGLGSLLCFGILLGSTISSLGTLCNVLVVRGCPLAYHARAFCALHVMYGVGAIFSPVLVSVLVTEGLSWPWTFNLWPPIALLVIFCLLWPKTDIDFEKEETQSARLSLPQIIVLTSFAAYVGGEVIVSMWLTTYLMEIEKMNLSQTAPYLSGFFIAMSMSRFLCFLSLKEKHQKLLLWLSLFLGSLFFISGRLGFLWGFSLSGLLGPFFPVLLARISQSFPQQWRSLMVWILVAMQTTLAGCHFVTGKLTDQLGIALTYWFPIALFAFSAAMMALYFNWETKVQKTIS